MKPEKLNLDESFRGTIFPPGTPLTGTFVNCSFYLASLNGVNIKDAKFFSCNFITATIRHSVLRDVKFSNCAFVGSSITQTDMFNVTFSACDFKGAHLAKIRGTSTCTFMLNCEWLVEADTDLVIKRIPERDHYLVCPKHMASGLERETNMPARRNGPNPIGFSVADRKVPRQTGAQSNLLLTAAELVDPEPLPEVNHYRSPPQKIPKDKKPYEHQSIYSYDEDDYSDCHYMMGGYGGMQQGRQGNGRHQGTYTTTRNSEYKFGYMSNGVLECSDFEEYSECPG